MPLKRLSDTVPCGLVSTREDGTIVAANAVFLEWLERPADAVINTLRLEDVLSGGSLIYFRTYLRPLLRMQGEINEIAFVLKSASGRTHEVLLSGRNHPDTQENAFVLFHAQNRRRYEREQHASRVEAETKANWLEQIEAMGGVGAWSLRVADQTLEWSDQVFETHGLPRGDTPSLSEALAFIPDPQQRIRVHDLIADASLKGHPFDVEITIYSALGAFRRLRVKGKAAWLRGRIDRINGIYQDVTDQRLAEAARDRAETQVSGIAENLPGVLLSLEIGPGDQTAVRFLSPRCHRIWGYRADEIRAALNAPEVSLPPDGPAAMIQQLARTARCNTPLERRIAIRAKSGEQRWLDMRGWVTRMGPDQLRADCVYLDVTREVETQAKLAHQTEIAQQAQKHESLGKLTGGMAHDFNNLLAVILGNLELMQDETDRADHRSMMAQAVKATQRGAGLTRAMLAFARQAPLDPETINLNDLVEETRSWTGRTLPATISVVLGLDPKLWPVEADVNASTSALLNLIVNARDAMNGKGVLRIDTANVHITQASRLEIAGDLAPGPYVRLRVTDSGQGIPASVLPHVFEPFFTTKPPSSGSGLGLSMVEGFLKQIGGTVRAESTEGQGARFTLFFPAQPGNSARPTPRPTDMLPAAPTQPARILVAEDEAAVRAVLGSILERAGHRVTLAETADAAQAIFAANPAFDLLLTDVVMPGTLQGPSLARALRRHRPGLPVIYITGYTSSDTGPHRDIPNAALTLYKPIRRAELLAAVNVVLEQSPLRAPGHRPKENTP